MHLSFARCFFFYLSFLFPPVEPGVFNCCETIKQARQFVLLRLLLCRFYFIRYTVAAMSI